MRVVTTTIMKSLHKDRTVQTDEQQQQPQVEQHEQQEEDEEQQLVGRDSAEEWQLVTHLTLARRQLQHAEEVRRYPALQSLDLSDNALRSFPPEVLALPLLRACRIKSNAIALLPDSLGTAAFAHSLEELFVTHNLLHHLPPSIACLTRLVNLDVGFNHLSSLPDSMVAMTNLQRLAIKHNAFRGCVPELVVHLPRLQYLDVAGNVQLDSTPHGFANLTQLRRFTFTNTNIDRDACAALFHDTNATSTVQLVREDALSNSTFQSNSAMPKPPATTTTTTTIIASTATAATAASITTTTGVAAVAVQTNVPVAISGDDNNNNNNNNSNNTKTENNSTSNAGYALVLPRRSSSSTPEFCSTSSDLLLDQVAATSDSLSSLRQALSLNLAALQTPPDSPISTAAALGLQEPPSLPQYLADTTPPTSCTSSSSTSKKRSATVRNISQTFRSAKSNVFGSQRKKRSVDDSTIQDESRGNALATLFEVLSPRAFGGGGGSLSNSVGKERRDKHDKHKPKKSSRLSESQPPESLVGAMSIKSAPNSPRHRTADFPSEIIIEPARVKKSSSNTKKPATLTAAQQQQLHDSKSKASGMHLCLSCRVLFQCNTDRVIDGVVFVRHAFESVAQSNASIIDRTFVARRGARSTQAKWWFVVQQQ
jgi:hypothetical protein